MAACQRQHGIADIGTESLVIGADGMLLLAIEQTDEMLHWRFCHRTRSVADG